MEKIINGNNKILIYVISLLSIAVLAGIIYVTDTTAAPDNSAGAYAAGDAAGDTAGGTEIGTAGGTAGDAAGDAGNGGEGATAGDAAGAGSTGADTGNNGEGTGNATADGEGTGNATADGEGTGNAATGTETAGSAAPGIINEDFFNNPAAGEANSTEGFTTLEALLEAERGSGEFTVGGVRYDGYTLPVQADIDAIYVDAGTKVTLWTGQPDAIIHYTLDATKPDASSPQYTQPITINGNTVIRAIAYAPQKLPSDILTRTYLTETRHNIPVVALTSDPEGLFSYDTGIYARGPGVTTGFPYYGANFWQDWEREAHFAYYEDGRLGVETGTGIEIHGNWSQALAQKSFLVKFKKAYGLGKVTYPFIPGIDRIVYDALVLRQSGQDWDYSKLKDAVISNSVLDVTNVVAAGARPVVMYLNGEYWGLYNLRERINEDYFKINHGIQNDEIDIVRMGWSASAGTTRGLHALENRLMTMEMNTDEAYRFVDANIDIDSWIDYWAIVTFFGNPDTSNIKCYRGYGEGQKWRWILFDQDHAMTLGSYNTIRNMMDPEGHSKLHGYHISTQISRSLMKNDRIKERFLTRYAELMRTVLSPGRLIAVLDDYAAWIEEEMPRQISRWRAPSSMAEWYENLETMRTFILGRETAILRFIRNTLAVPEDDMQRIFG